MLRRLRQVSIAVVLAAMPATATLAYDWRLPAWMPPPPVPAENPMTAEKVELGRHLFYDSRLSAPSYLTCGHCHRPEYGFADYRARSFGMSGEQHPRNTQGLANVGYLAPLTWRDPLMHSLEEQVLVPLFAVDPIEMMARGMEREIALRLSADRGMRERFLAAFPETSGRIDMESLTKAIAAFQRSLVSFDAPYDRWRHGGEAGALSPLARQGLELFESKRAACAVCHVPPLFTDATLPRLFAGTGLGIEDPAAQRRRRASLEAGHEPRGDGTLYRTPSLRNVAVTAPYMHDGGVPTLEAVLERYATGHDADGSPLRLSAEQRAALLAFLEALTDEAFLADPRHHSPYSNQVAVRAGPGEVPGTIPHRSQR